MIRWQEVLAAGERRHGVVTRDDLLAVGLNEGQVGRLTSEGRLVRVGPSTYRVGGAPDTFEARVLGAILDLGGTAWASHRTAARLHGIAVHGPAGVIDITRPTTTSANRGSVHVHRSTRVPARHITTVRRVPTTTVPRTLFDLAWKTGPVILDRAVEEALRKRLCTVGELYRIVYELGGRGRPGTRKMRDILEVRGRDYVPTKSDLELIGRALLQEVPGIEWEVPMSDDQGFVRSVDGLVGHARLVVEFDGSHHWRSRAEVEVDRSGDARLVRLGFVVQRLTWLDLTVRADATRALVDRLVQGGAA